jgi:prepilin-type N-terminal cleavage/methylation domain-containing protein
MRFSYFYFLCHEAGQWARFYELNQAVFCRPKISAILCLMSVLAYRRAFTLIELLIVIGIIGLLAAIVILAINPTRFLTNAKDAKRVSEAKQMQNALYQYLIDKGTYPNSSLIPSNGSGSALPICKQGITDASCITLDALAPDYLASIPQDAAETDAQFSGYTIYSAAGRALVLPSHLGVVTEVAASGPTLISSGLIAYWKLDEASGTTAVDSSGNGHDGTLINGPVHSVGRLQGALQFNGVSTYVDTALNPATTLGQTITFTAWVYPRSAAAYQGVAGAHIGSYQGIVFFQFEGPGWDSAYGAGTQWAAPNYTTLPLNTWSHVVAVIDGGTSVKTYVNGVLANSVAETLPISHYTNFWIGRAFDNGGRYFNGDIDDVRVYNRILSTAEITQIAEGEG